MNKCIVILIVSIVILIIDLIIFIKTRQDKKDIEENIERVSEDKEIFFDFFVR